MRENYDAYYKDYRQANKDKMAARSKIWYVTNKQEWWSIAATVTELKCEVCGYDKHSSGLDFHHKNPEEKEGTIHQMMNGPAPNETNVQKFIAEIKKCVVLCANCHREHHAKYNFLPFIAGVLKK